MKPVSHIRSHLHGQRGLGLLGVLFWIALLGSILLLGMRIIPIANEYLEIKKTINLAKGQGDAAAIRSSFDLQSRTNYSDGLTSRDLKIETVNGVLTIEFAYQRVVPLAGPVSLLFDLTGKETAR